MVSVISSKSSKYLNYLDSLGGIAEMKCIAINVVLVNLTYKN